MEIDIAGMTIQLDPKRAFVRIAMPGGAFIEKQGVEVVLLFGILAALTKTPGKAK